MKKLVEKTKKMKEIAPSWFKRNKKTIIVLISFNVVLATITIFDWWAALGILFIKFGLGMKVAGVKTFGKAVAKVGGKKVLATATGVMLAKRHAIDVFTKFFTEHSISKFSDSIKKVLKLKVLEFKETSIWKKIQAFGAMILAIPGIYFFWTKFVSVFIQKFVYGVVIIIWNFISGTFNVIGFLLEVLALNVLIDWIGKFSWGKKIVSFIDSIVYLFADILSIFNIFFEKFLSFLGIQFSFKSWLIYKSLKFNKWLESILDKGLDKITKRQRKRERYVNGFERISEKRYEYIIQKQDKKLSFLEILKESYRKKYGKKTWREKREERKQKQKERSQKYVSERRKQKQIKSKRESLTLPYQKLVRYGDIPYRPR